jgi:trigger factor
MDKADMNEELFKKVYGEEVKDEASFRNKIREELEKMFEQESEKKLRTDIMNQLIEDLKIQLPDDFLKRWLVAVNEKPVTMDQVDAEYDQYSRGLKWQLIENKILKDFDIKVSSDEAAEYVKSLVREQYQRYNQVEIDEEELNGTVSRILQNEKEANRIYEKLYSDKILDVFKNNVTIDTKEVSYEDFFKGGSN